MDDWRKKARCKKLNVEQFYAERYESNRYYREVEAVCCKCPVRMECLQHACIQPEDFGMWGGWPVPKRDRFKRVAKFWGVDLRDIKAVRRLFKTFQLKKGFFQPTLSDVPKEKKRKR